MADYDFDGDEFLGDGAQGSAVATTEEQAPAATASTEQAATPPPPAEPATTEPAVPAATTEPAATPPATVALSAETSALLARERLPAVANETEAAALRRLYDHQRQRGDRLYYEEVRGARAAAQAAREELSAFQQAMRPLILAFNERKAEAERELAAAQVPEQGTPEYLAWQQQQIIARLDAREQQELAFREQDAEYSRQAAVLDLDEAANTELDQAIATDPEARTAYEFAVQLAARAVSRTFPDATPDQIQEVVHLSHILDMRNAKANGVSPGELFKQRMADVKALFGGVPVAPVVPAAPPAPPPPAATTTNGKSGSPTARQLAAAKAQSSARAVVSPTPSASAAPTGDGMDFSQLDEEALLDFVLSDSSNAAEYSRWVESRHSKSGWRG